MRYEISIKGISPLLVHSTRGMDDDDPLKIQLGALVKKRGVKTETERRAIKAAECELALWLDERGTPRIPAGAIKALLNQAAKKRKEGPLVREGVVVESVGALEYDKTLGVTPHELANNPKVQFTVDVKVGQARTMRTRPRFNEWGCTFVLDVDDELVEEEHIIGWLDIGGRRVGLGDWRPTCNGNFGRFEAVSVKALG